MRSAALSQLAFGLLIVDSAFGSPCKPTSVGTTTFITSAASTETVSATWTVSTALTDTSAPVEPISSSTTDESSAEELSTSWTIIVTTLTAEISASTDLDMATTATASAVTTSAVPMPTFTILAVGQGSMEGRSLKTYPAANNVAVFDPPDSQGAFAAAPNPFTIDETGRLINNQGFFLCGFYSPTSFLLDAPADVGTCSDEFELSRAFLHCKLDAGSKVRCEIPAISCTTDDPDDIFGFPTCEKADGKWSTMSIRVTGPGHVLHIGPENSPSYYERLEIGIQEI